LLSWYSNQSMVHGIPDAFFSGCSPPPFIRLLALRRRLGPGEGRLSVLLVKKDIDKWEPFQRGRPWEPWQWALLLDRAESDKDTTVGGPNKVPPSIWKGVSLEDEDLFFVGMDSKIRTQGRDT
jgi:hypothetical protein